jgi:hypothetical protein
MTKRKLATTLVATLVVFGIVFSKNAEELTFKIPGLSPQSKEWIASWFQKADEGIIVQDVQAYLYRWSTWPRSKQHKDFDGKWIMPFEIFIQSTERLDRTTTGTNFVYKPYATDINGDGRLDLIYSKMVQNANIYDADQFTSGGVEQYIAIRKSNGYQMAYTCIHKSNAAGHWYYYGDCASNPTTDTLPAGITEQAWTPHSFFYEHTINWETNGQQNEPFVITDLYSAGTPIYINARDPIINRYMPEVMDINADGLPDIIFSKNQPDTWYNHSTNTAVGYGTFILYNNGRGFDVGTICNNLNSSNMIYDNSNQMFDASRTNETRLQYGTCGAP